MTRVGALWIGGLEPYMDENFLSNAMIQMGQDGVVSIKVMNNKFTGEPAGYGFINFESDQKAIFVMHRLGGKVIPGSSPPVRFKLNHNSTRLQPGEIDTSVWVGDLTPEVDDFALYQFFTQRYQTVRCAKVVLDENGYSKGYGFVRFGAEAEQQHALANMTGEMGLGQKPIKVSMANQKNRMAAGGPGGPGGMPPVGNGSGRGGGGGGGGGMGMGWGAIGGAPGGGASGNGASDGAGGWPGTAVGSWPGSGQTPGSAAGSAGSPLAPAAATAAAATPDYSAYYQQYAQYAAQSLSQAQQQAQAQQQQQYAAAWAATAWQQQQQQQQQQ